MARWGKKRMNWTLMPKVKTSNKGGAVGVFFFHRAQRFAGWAALLHVAFYWLPFYLPRLVLRSGEEGSMCRRALEGLGDWIFARVSI